MSSVVAAMAWADRPSGHERPSENTDGGKVTPPPERSTRPGRTAITRHSPSSAAPITTRPSQVADWIATGRDPLTPIASHLPAQASGSPSGEGCADSHATNNRAAIAVLLRVEIKPREDIAEQTGAVARGSTQGADI